MTFVEACWDGEAFLDDIDSWVEQWYRSRQDVPLHEFLGMTEEQYARWVHRPSELQSILEEYSPPEEET